MLPQMMPLPWVFVFFLTFITFFMVTLYVSSVSGDAPVGQLKVKPGSLLLLW